MGYWMVHNDGFWAVLILFTVVVAPLWLFLHYGWRWRQARLRSGATERTLAELADLAERMQARIDNLERLLDVAAPQWRNKP